MNPPIQIKPQSEFPLIKEYAQHFDITPRTIFAWNNAIYTNYALPNDLLIHEKQHILRQNQIGVDVWVKKFLHDPEFRLNEERLAYIAQLNSIKHRELRNKVRIESAENLSSSLYGNLCTKAEAMSMLF